MFANARRSVYHAQYFRFISSERSTHRSRRAAAANIQQYHSDMMSGLDAPLNEQLLAQLWLSNLGSIFRPEAQGGRCSRARNLKKRA